MAARRGLWLVLILIMVAVLTSAAGLAFVYTFVGRPRPIPSNATLVLRVSADLPEYEPPGLPTLWSDQPTLRGLVGALRRAKTDRRIQGVVVVPGGTPALWGKTQELRDALLDFRKAGKPLVAYLEYAGNQEYYLASACDKVYLMPSGTIDLGGLASYEMFLRGTLDKLGIYPDFVHIGDYKTAVNTFTEEGFTPAHREMITSLNADAFGELVRGIATSRKKSEADVRAIVDTGPLLPEDALAHGLVDDLAYLDEVRKKSGIEPRSRLLESRDYLGSEDGGFGFTQGSRVALIYAVGAITPGRSGESWQGGYVGSDTLNEYIRKVREDSSIKAVVLRVDSPGGSSIASDAIWRELMLTREVKPLIVSMSDLAASGGYYIAMPAHVIVAQPGTLTGSIGIFGGKFVTAGLMSKVGARIESVSEGRFAEMGSPARPFTPEERAKLEEHMQAFYDQFVEKVAEARRSTPEQIDAMAQGRVWTGRQAKDLGLVDELGGLSRAMAIARERAGIGADAPVELVVYPPRKSFFEWLADPLSGADDGRSLLLDVFATPSERRALAAVQAPLRLLRHGEPLALMPYVFVRP
ncbi:MAG: signal peptide peptidase SppA [Luteitalea sp.]|nr:signal peptide peptidase SppA [Luteitalea sp.]